MTFLVGTLPVDTSRGTPERLDIVVHAVIRLEDVDHGLHEVDDHPGRPGVDIGSERGLTTFLAEIRDGLGHGLHLSLAAACTDQDVVADLAEPANIKQQDLGALVILQGTSQLDGEGLDDFGV